MKDKIFVPCFYHSFLALSFLVFFHPYMVRSRPFSGRRGEFELSVLDKDELEVSEDTRDKGWGAKILDGQKAQYHEE